MVQHVGFQPRRSGFDSLHSRHNSTGVECYWTALQSPKLIGPGSSPGTPAKTLHAQLDHKNGVANDHRLENLQFICPNCHTQTPTYGSKNRGSGRKYKRDYYQHRVHASI